MVRKAHFTSVDTISRNVLSEINCRVEEEVERPCRRNGREGSSVQHSVENVEREEYEEFQSGAGEQIPRPK
jgi:hypothetical protein